METQCAIQWYGSLSREQIQLEGEESQKVRHNMKAHRAGGGGEGRSRDKQ